MPEDKRGQGFPCRNSGIPAPADGTGPEGTGSGEAELNRKLRRMASLSRHDISNQLTIINGYLSLLESGSSAITIDDTIRILQDATDRIQLILRFTRDYQEIGANPPAWQDLEGLIQAARASVDTGMVRLTVSDACRHLSICADPLAAKVFSSLIDNSLRHGKNVSEIQVTCREADRQMVIVYEDNGGGIAPAVRPVLFEPGKGRKTGYGLFLVRDILGMTGITITETGSAGTGVRFEILVPEGRFRNS